MSTFERNLVKIMMLQEMGTVGRFELRGMNEMRRMYVNIAILINILA